MDDKTKPPIIAIDAMGGDLAPAACVEGAVLAANSQKVHIVLAGQPEAIEAELKKYDYPRERLEIVPASEVISSDEQPTAAIKQKKDSSITVGLRLLAENRADAFISAGSTGALLTGATLLVGRLPGVLRPALAAMLPNERGFTMLLDAGANMDAKPSYLLQFAKMGALYMEHIMEVKNPRVGIVNVGAEREKGNILTKEAYGLLEGGGLNFVGNVEARELSSGVCDVIVCDAFVGNIILKYTEGFAKSLFNIIKREASRSFSAKIGAFMMRGAFSETRRSFDYTEVGGAPLLGLNSLVFKAHGSSNAKAVKAAVGRCAAFAERGVVTKIRQEMENMKAET
ncbi:MAG: phosphate acyltransferase PlsX [Clostridiales bacterium]|jgi:glycerol-3-phosphate acyltransferase PlsX|nr:phosphate acyltransferase PlsX [Clostridiales bacterium]